MHEDEAFAKAEDKLLRTEEYLDAIKVADFCNAFYADTQSLMMKPFMVYEEGYQYGKIPDNYIPCLNHLQDRWKAEQERYEGERKASEGLSPSPAVASESTAPVADGDPLSRILSELENLRGSTKDHSP
jgi:hypothetical protein